MDNPELIVACVVGDGEAETGLTATAWHGYKHIDLSESGAVIPIFHVNGFKISERTIYGMVDDPELTAPFRSAISYVSDRKCSDKRFLHWVDNDTPSTSQVSVKLP